MRHNRIPWIHRNTAQGDNSPAKCSQHIFRPQWTFHCRARCCYHEKIQQGILQPTNMPHKRCQTLHCHRTLRRKNALQDSCQMCHLPSVTRNNKQLSTSPRQVRYQVHSNAPTRLARVVHHPITLTLESSIVILANGAISRLSAINTTLQFRIPIRSKVATCWLIADHNIERAIHYFSACILRVCERRYNFPQI